MSYFSSEVTAAVDDHFQAVVARDQVPGIAYGLIADGRLVHAGGVGARRVGAAEIPGPSTSSRICSMTKSFVAAGVLALRDEGRLGLDDSVVTFIPALANLELPTLDSAPLRIRDLMSMSSGLPDDDAWGDRLMNLEAREVDELFSRIGAFAHAPGVAYEYSNLGWVMLGRVITTVSGMSAQAFVSDRLLRPLRMNATDWNPPVGEALTGYRVQDGEWVEELPPLADGDFAPMAGLWSTVEDLATWVAFFLDAFPARDEPDTGPLRRSSRREMQQAHRAWRSTYDAETGRLDAGGYGFGLTVVHDLRFGHMVGHAGGLPGFGSHMRWLPECGVGVVGLANLTYAPIAQATLEILEFLDDHNALPGPFGAPASTGLAEASEGLCGLLNEWSDDAADALFAINVFLDEDRERRRRDAAALRDACGHLRVGSIKAESATRASVTYIGELGDLEVVILLTPERNPLIQKYTLTPTSSSPTAQGGA
jgi:CubicO group peptidase (beta-lactamase class C family)